MKLASYIDRNSAHEALYKSVSQDGAIYPGVLVRPNMLVSLNVNDPDVVATTEKDALDRLLWVKLNDADETPTVFVDVKWDGSDNAIRGFFYDEYDELDETPTGVMKFHGLLPSGSDVTFNADELWVSPWDEPVGPSHVYHVTFYDKRRPGDPQHGYFQWVADRSVFRELSARGLVLNSSQYDVDCFERAPSVGDIADVVCKSLYEDDGFKLLEVSNGVYVVTEVSPGVREALRWL